jgi:hypothetical protein
MKIIALTSDSLRLGGLCEKNPFWFGLAKQLGDFTRSRKADAGDGGDVLSRHGFFIISMYCTYVNISEGVAQLQGKSFWIVVKSKAARG